MFLVKSKHWVLAEIRFFVCLWFFEQDFCSRVLFLANPGCVHGLFLVILYKIWICWPANRSFEFLRGVNPVGDDCMDLHPYSHDRFSKLSRLFFASRNMWIIVVFLQQTLKEKSPFVLINTLLLHIPVLALTDG